MAYTGPIASRPSQITGCFQTFRESALESTVRTDTDTNTVIKVRRRTTAAVRVADATITVKQDEVPYWKTWFETNCQSGVLPTKIITPYGAEEVWRFAEPLQIEWNMGPRPGQHSAVISVKLEQLPLWRK